MRIIFEMKLAYPRPFLHVHKYEAVPDWYKQRDICSTTLPWVSASWGKSLGNMTRLSYGFRGYFSDVKVVSQIPLSE